jgi:hypothetical protein
MIYVLNKSTLQYEKVGAGKLALIFLSTVVIVAGALILVHYYAKSQPQVVDVTNYETVLLPEYEQEFSPEALFDLLKKYNLKFPHIAMAQSEVETGYFKSNIFRESNNLFGMKEAKIRPTTATGTQFDHAMYESWQHSVYDYVLWVAAYGVKARTEDDFYALLERQYAGDKDYVRKLKKLSLKYKHR